MSDARTWWHHNRYSQYHSPSQQLSVWKSLDTNNNNDDNVNSIINHSSYNPSPWLTVPVTVTLTDIVYTTTQGTTTFTTTPYDGYDPNNNNAIAKDNNNSNYDSSSSNSNDEFSHHLHQLLPALGLFAVIGLLAILVLLGYMGYRFYKSSNNDSRRDQQRLRNNNNWPSYSSEGEEDVGGRRGERDLEPIVFENSASELKAHYAPPWSMYQQKRPMGAILDSPIENSGKPISTTFIPINKSPLTLVPRMEVWQDPQRRRGVDELDLWEKKQQQKHPIHEDHSPRSSETIQPVNTTTQPTSHIEIARKALEKSRLENSSSQWLHFSGSKSL
ncbi:hypothetical protein INT45_008842 [Circinella minor]|uniref:Uncharacterized protein n=1 Tax=Circinella minor TaxID=1195481 RepID=A0A8H7S4D2_9FUNG|nr:hypothetical protein INT45_008842 [Circinella minor]